MHIDYSQQTYPDGWDIGIDCPANGSVTLVFNPYECRLGLRDGDAINLRPNDRWVQLLTALVRNPNKEIDLTSPLVWEDENLGEEISSLEQRTVQNAVNVLKNEIARVFTLNNLQPPPRDGIVSRKLSGATGSVIHRLTGDVTQRVITGLRAAPAPERPELMMDYQTQRRLLRVAESRIDVLMTQLVEAYPEELDGFFFKNASGTLFPFYHMASDGLPSPVFPLQIADPPAGDRVPDRLKASLLTQRKAEGRKLNNGKIYRLLAAQDGTWTLGRTNYFSVLESCDFLRERMFERWGLYFEQIASPARRRDAQLAFLRQDPVVQEWVRRVCEIRRGDFSGYHAGIAFNTPLFSRYDGRLHLVLAEESKKKATGGGKLHVCPAGMMEFYRNTYASTLGWEDFRLYMAKELVEETLNHKLFRKQEWISAALEGDWIDWTDPDNKAEKALLDLDETGDADLSMLAAIVNGICNQPEKVGTSTEALDKLVTMPAEDFDPICIVDAFRLRPEIIQPLHLRDQPALYVNWEYATRSTVGGSEIVEIFNDLADLEQRAESGIAKWTEPGIAAMLLGGRRMFAAAPANTGVAAERGISAKT